MTRSAIVFLGLCLALSHSACATKRTLNAEQQEQVKPFVSSEAPKPQHALDIRFDDKLTLIGYDLSQPAFESGKPLTITWYYKVSAPVPSGYRQFTHLADARDRSRVNLDSTGPLRSLFEPELWQAGSYVRDEQTVTLPENWNSPKAVFFLGFWKGDKRLPVHGPQDKLSRARALEVPVLGVDAQLPVLRAAAVEAPAKGAAITLDGKLDEPAWQKAESSALFVNTRTGEPVELKVTAKTAWDKEHLYVAFDVADSFLKSSFTQHDEHLWEQDCVEIMIDPDGDGKNYFELQVSPLGVSFDTHYDTRRVPQPFGHVDFDSGLKAGVDVRGQVNDDQSDEGYTAEIAIPWAAFAYGQPKHAAPEIGDTWRLNFYVMDALKAGIRAAGWSPPLVGDFHVPARFGKLVFEGAAAQAERAEAGKQADSQPAAAPEAAKVPAKASTKKSAAAP